MVHGAKAKKGEMAVRTCGKGGDATLATSPDPLRGPESAKSVVDG